MEQIKKVHVVYKTHLDVGFTDLAHNVIDKYVNSFIPKAINLAKKVNKDGENKKFVWTVGSWLIDEYLRRADEKARYELDDAIHKGYIVWHGLPFTMHSELMDEELFKFGISISKELDLRYSKDTIAAKMTDVPGHTRGIIKPLYENGIKYLHLGVNDVSHKPNVYDTFVWRDSKGCDIIVDYCQGYGKTTIVPGFDEVLVFAHSGDNLGPPSEEEIYRQLEKIQNQFPNAEVKASTLDEYAKALIRLKDKLPVITDEIGDTWIHGIASDPYKVSCFLELLRLKDKWIKEGRINKQSDAYKEFMRSLLMIPEHTWGLDFKKYIADYKNWEKVDFIKARRIDKLSDDYITEKYVKFGEFAKKEFSEQIKHMKWEDRSYSYFESSHNEQRGYLNSAIEALPDYLKEEAFKAIVSLKQCIEKEAAYEELSLDKEYTINDFSINILQDGSIKLKSKVIKKDIILGKVCYEVFGSKTFKNWEKDYMVNLDKNALWGYPDFFKPGTEDAGIPEDNIRFGCRAEKAFKLNNELYIEAVFQDYECSEYGCPRKVIIKYIFLENEINISAYLYQKDASRLPEALWISHFIDISTIEDVKLKKLEEIIDPFQVVEYGNRNYHSIKEVSFLVDDSKINIIPFDATLLSIGEMRLYNFNQEYANKSGGFHFNLYNNLWGTNFKMWYEEDIISRFKIFLE